MARKKQEEFDELIIGGQVCPKNKKFKSLEEKKVVAYFVSEVHPFSNCGAYIPCSDEYLNKKVYVVVLK
jgi:putative transposon-encoded protein